MVIVGTNRFKESITMPVKCSQWPKVAVILATFFLPVDDFTTRRKAPKNHG